MTPSLTSSGSSVASRLAALAAVAVLFVTAGCASSRGRPPIPYPEDPSKDSTYCLKYLPPTYREVPHLVECAPSKVCQECSWKKEVTFETVCTPGRYDVKTTPCRTRKTVELVVEPARTVWAKASCQGEKDCYKPCETPARTKCCEVTETENGLAYCAFTPPEYQVVQKTRIIPVQTPVYRPAQYRVVHRKEEFMGGRYVWVKRDDCDGCPPTRAPQREGFNYAPPAD